MPESFRGRWYLCGDVSEGFFQLALADSSRGYTVGLFSTPEGTKFAFFVLQLLNRQARFLLPLISEKAIRFIDQVERIGLYLSLGRNGGEDAVLVEFQCAPEMLAPLRRFSKDLKNIPKDLSPLDLRIAGQHVADRTSVPSAHPALEVDEVCMNIILD
jgi:hypothetical protein